MNYDSEQPRDEAKQTLGLVIVVTMYVSFFLTIIVLRLSP